MRCDRLWTNARLATLAPEHPGIGEIEGGVIAAQDGRILYAGAAAQAPAFAPDETVDCDGRWITPGLIDPHTHLVFGGDRAQEFEMRLAGASYEEIARAGGGIVSTMRATRAADEDTLVAAALPRLDAGDHPVAHGQADIPRPTGLKQRAFEPDRLRVISHWTSLLAWTYVYTY